MFSVPAVWKIQDGEEGGETGEEGIIALSDMIGQSWALFVCTMAKIIPLMMLGRQGGQMTMGQPMMVGQQGGQMMMAQPMKVMGWQQVPWQMQPPQMQTAVPQTSQMYPGEGTSLHQGPPPPPVPLDYIIRGSVN